MLLDSNYTIVPSIRFTLTYDNGIRKVITVKTRDTIDCSYKKNGERFSITGVVTKIGCNFNSSLGAVGTTAYLQVDGSSEYAGQVEYIQPSQVLDLTIISTTDITDNVVCSVDNDDQKITLIRENEVGVFQYSLDGITWKFCTGGQGMSAYECAVELGFVGTEAEWLESLKGKQGDPGEPGGLEIYKVFTSLAEAENNRDLIPKGKLVAVTTSPNSILLVRNGTNNANANNTISGNDTVVVKGYDYLGYLTVGPQGPQGDPGDPGQDGKSAYQYAVEGGFGGSEDEFMQIMANCAVAVTNYYMGPTGAELTNTVIGPIDLRVFGYTNERTFKSKSISRIDISSPTEEEDQTLIFPEPVILRAVPTAKESAKPNVIIRGQKYVADVIMKKDGKVGVLRRVKYIASYNGETILGDWISSTGQLDMGAQVQHTIYGYFEPFDELVQSQYKKFHSYDQKTNIFTEEGTYMSVSYPINITAYVENYVKTYFDEKAPEIIEPMVTAEVTRQTAGKQDKLTAGANITIDENNVISATGGSGSITGIKMNGEIKGTSGVVDLGTVVTEHQSLANYYNKSEVDTKVSDEKTRAEGVEGTLNTAISNEVTRATTAEGTLQTAINTEKTRAEGVESTLSTSISNEVTRATTAEGTLQTAIDTEKTRATNAESTLQTAINTEKSRAETAENNLSTKKQDKLTAGTNITIDENNVISANDDAGPNKIKYNNGLALYKDDTEIAGQTDKVVFKTVNTQSIIGSGDISIKTYSPFPSDFVTEGTLEQVVNSMLDSTGAKEGMAYLGEIAGECVPFGGNAECKVEFMLDDICVLSINSSNISPYSWMYNSASDDFAWKKYSDVTANISGATTSISSIGIDGDRYLIRESTSEDFTVTNAVGGYKSGDVITAGTSLMDIIRNILAPIVPPSVNKVYYGVTTNIPTSLEGLTGEEVDPTTLITDGFMHRYTAEEQYLVYAYKASIGELISIKDPSGFEQLAGWSKTTYNDGTDNYYIYYSNENVTVSSFKLTFIYTD